MFTQCSKCETVYRLSADSLRAAGGQVRCGRCGEVFNALARLAEDASGFTKGESPLFLESRAEEILHSSSSDLHAGHEPPDEHDHSSNAALAAGPGVPPAADPPAQPPANEASQAGNEFDLPPGVEMAQLQFIGLVDDDLAAETSLEFTLPPGELDRIFIETQPSPLQRLATDGFRAVGGESAERGDVVQLHPDQPPAHPEALHLHPDAIALHPEAIALHPEAAPEIKAAPSVSQAPPVTQRAPGPAPLTRIAGLEVSEDVRREMLSSLRIEGLREPPLRTRLPFVAWLTAAVVLGVLLLIQVVRGNSDWLATHVPLLAAANSPAAGLSVYQLRQWGVTGDPAAKGSLRVRASIMNTAPQLQPYPLLRVTLVNRFGARVAAREFEPAEYLGRDPARMLAPGERIDATLDILDPGKDAEGFEIDVCLRGADKQIFCAGEAAAHSK